MEDDFVAVRTLRGALLEQVRKEPLDDFSQDELEARIALLDAEKARVATALEKKRSGRSAAEALFSFKAH